MSSKRQSTAAVEARIMLHDCRTTLIFGKSERLGIGNIDASSGALVDVCVALVDALTVGLAARIEGYGREWVVPVWVFC